MPAKDIIHNIVRAALVSDGWTITHDPFKIRMGNVRVFADLGAEKALAAEKDSRKIAVEIKSFAGPSLIDELEKALGQYGLYVALLDTIEPDRTVYLAVSEESYTNVFDTAAGRIVMEKLSVRLIVVHLGERKIVKWIE
jgi:hypothetical protein